MRLSISKAWDEASAILRTDGKLVATVVAAMVMLPIALDTLIAPTATATVEGEAGSGGLLGLIVFLVGLIGQVAVAAIGLNRGATVGEALRIGVRRFLPVFGALLLFFFPITLILVIVLISQVGAENIANLQAMIAAGQAPAAAMWTIFLWLLAVLYFGIRFALVTPIGVAENSSAVGMLRRSWSLTRGNFWKLLGFALLLGIALVIASMASNALFGFAISATLGAPEPMSMAALVLGLLNGAIQAVFMAIYVLMLARIYVQLAAPASVPEV